MKRNIILGLMLLAFGAPNVMADGVNKFLNVQQKESSQCYELAVVKKIVFNQENTIIVLSEGQLVVPSAEMDKISFTATGTSIEGLPEQAKGLRVVAGTLQVEKPGIVRVFSTNGVLMSAVKVNGNATVSMNNLPKGLYIVSAGNQTIKINKK